MRRCATRVRRRSGSTPKSRRSIAPRKEIVARHEGSLRVRSSQSPAHHGTVFALFLPFDATTRQGPPDRGCS